MALPINNRLSVEESLLSNKLSTNQFLAKEFVFVRLERFNKLSLRVRKLILEIALYYLDTFYPFDNEALDIGTDIRMANSTNDEPLMTTCYKRFLEFLPIGTRSGIQGRNLFKQPSEAEQLMAHYYVNNLEHIQKHNQELYTPDESGLTAKDRILLMHASLEKELGLEEANPAGMEANELAFANP